MRIFLIFFQRVIEFLLEILLRCLAHVSLFIAMHLLLHQQVTSTWWCSPFSFSGEGRNGLPIPQGSHPRTILSRTTFLLIFYPCCPLRNHIWTAFLNPNDRPSISSTISTTFFSLFSHPKPPLYLSPLLFILMLLSHQR